MKRLTKDQLIKLLTLLAAIVAYAIFWALYPDKSDTGGISGLPYAVSRAIIGCLILTVIDETLLYKIETYKILKDDAKAYSIFLLAYALVIAISIGTA